MAFNCAPRQEAAHLTKLLAGVGLALSLTGCSSCSSQDVLGFIPCGNGVLDAGETCDGEAFGEASCASVTGFVDGRLRCNDSCDGFDASDCHGCGDGVIDLGEECEGVDLGGQDCVSIGQGFAGGLLGCDPLTCRFDVSRCERCGNGLIDEGEDCDGGELNGNSCTSVPGGFMGGVLSCDASRCVFDVSGCHHCGDGAVDPGEGCDDGNDNPYDDCTTSCEVARCGDGILWDSGAGTETCDNGEGNSDIEPDACRSDCRLPRCGDGVIDSGEDCDAGATSSDHCCTQACEFVGAGHADPQGFCLSGGLGLRVCDGSGGCMEIPPDELAPAGATDGLPSPVENVYTDEGVAPDDAAFRALLGLHVRNRDDLEARVRRIYDPADSDFRHTMSVAEWMDAYAPLPEEYALIRAWLESEGLRVGFEATNRLLIQFSGTAAQFRATFNADLHIFERKNPQAGNPPIEVYGTLDPTTLPVFVASRVTGVLTADLPASTDPLPGEDGGIEVSPQDSSRGRTVAQIARAYGLEGLYDQGYRGAGVKLGVVVGATFKVKDLQSFWQSMGLSRSNPTVIETMEPVATRYLETTIDTEWSGGLAPEAELVVYEGPDSRNTSMVYTWNEAIARNEVSVITSSFAHREDSEPRLVREQYSRSALMGAALGITLLAASGDSEEPDTPSSSPFVTAVGGTTLQLGPDGSVSAESAWTGTGSGITLSFALPYYQVGTVTDSAGKRAVVDLAVNASPASAYWTYYVGEWQRYGGTSFASPAFAGMVAVINCYRLAHGKPVVGFLNPILYLDTAVQAAFRDVTTGGTSEHSAGPGWDYPTGWGAPLADDLAEALP